MKARTSPWLRRIVAALAIGGVMIPVLASGAQAARFTDVPNGHQFLKEITWLAQSGITTGYANGTFQPKEQVSREAFAAFLYRDAGRPAVTLPSNSPFKDLPKSAQFYKEVVWLSQQNITTGWADGTFRPKATIDRDAMAAFLYRAQGRPSFSPPSTSPFKDMTPSSKFYKEVTWLSQSGITTGFADGTFKPRNGVTREATAAFFYRMAGKPPVDVPSMVPKSFTMSGAGFGHGVGMSQYGAQGMAVEGYNAGEILRHYYTGTQVSTVDANRDLRVEIFGSGSDNRNAFDIIVTGDWRMRFFTSPTAWTTWEGKAGERLKIDRSGYSVKVTRADGSSKTATRDVVLDWENTRAYKPSSTRNATVDLYARNSSSRVTHGTYRHGRIFINVPSQLNTPRLIVANELKLNTEYLYGIAEVPSSWHIDTLQAQAIVARGYAIKNMGSLKATCNCHIYDDIRDQQFSGWRKENEGANAQYGKRWVDGVNRTTSSNGTHGKVLTKGGSIVVTHYFSSSGGRTENSEDIWTATLSHERAVDDRWSLESRNPNRAWTRTITQAQARSMFGLSDVVSIQVTARTSSSPQAAARVVTATSSTGQKSTITRPETIRSRVVGGHSPWIWSFTPNF